MNEKTLRALVEAGAIKRIRIVAKGCVFHVEADTPNGTITAATLKGKVKTWSTLDASARWVRALGIGEVRIQMSQWQPDQRGMKI